MVQGGFVRALDGFEAVLAGVAPGRWDAPSPCQGWCAADVASHVIGDLRAVEAYATGRQEADGAADPRSAAGKGEFLERYLAEILVHTWDLAQATGQAVGLDPARVSDALEPARQFAPVLRASDMVGPECAVVEDADDLTRLLAIFGRRNPAG